MSALRTDPPVPRLATVLWKTAVAHTVTYFAVGLIAFLVLDYDALFRHPRVGGLMRETSHPMVAAGPLFQPLRGLLLGIVLWMLRDVTLARPRGWLTWWGTLVILGILAPFGPGAGSLEGAIYTRLPAWFHLVGLPETLLQSLLCARLSHFWITRARGPGPTVALLVLFGIAVALSALGAAWALAGR